MVRERSPPGFRQWVCMLGTRAGLRLAPTLRSPHQNMGKNTKTGRKPPEGLRLCCDRETTAWGEFEPRTLHARNTLQIHCTGWSGLIKTSRLKCWTARLTPNCPDGLPTRLVPDFLSRLYLSAPSPQSRFPNSSENIQWQTSRSFLSQSNDCHRNFSTPPTPRCLRNSNSPYVTVIAASQMCSDRQLKIPENAS